MKPDDITLPRTALFRADPRTGTREALRAICDAVALQPFTDLIRFKCTHMHWAQDGKGFALAFIMADPDSADALGELLTPGVRKKIAEAYRDGADMDLRSISASTINLSQI